jgi:O-acetyl-ADP-ribose deacetylase (regulator of RNase III)
MPASIELYRGDITRLEVDVIVNAANTSLLGGGGVDGAIHRAAGHGLLEECRKLRGCPTGEARITAGYLLPARHVIHTVGPVWNGGKYNEEQLLANCYRNSLSLAVLNNCKSIAFPNISTGVYRYPKEAAATVAIREVRKFLATDRELERVIFVCFDQENFDLYNRLLSEK